jgi:hypothetical protein
MERVADSGSVYGPRSWDGSSVCLVRGMAGGVGFWCSCSGQCLHVRRGLFEQMSAPLPMLL